MGLDTQIGSLFGTPFSLALFGFTADFGELLRNFGRLARRTGHGAALEGALEVDVRRELVRLVVARITASSN